MIDLRSASLIDFVPPSIADDPEIVAMSEALDPEIQDVAAHVDDAIIMASIDSQPEPVLDAIAWSVKLTDLPLWDNATVSGKRSLLKEIFGIRQRAGTVWSVKRIFVLLHLVARVIEWFEEAADPDTYRLILDASEIGISRDQLLQVPELLRRFAPTRNRLQDITIEGNVTGTLRLYPMVTRGRIVTISGGP